MKFTRARGRSAIGPAVSVCRRLPRRLPSAFLLVLGFAAAPACWADTTFSAYYTGEFWRNADGGIRTGGGYLSDAGLKVASELDGLFGGVDSGIFAYFLWNNAKTFSDRYVGDAQVVSNIDAQQAVRVYELWYQQYLNEDVSLRFGLYDLNSEFDALDTASLFINSSHGIGAEYGQSGVAGPSIFPVTSLAARFDLAIDDRNLLRYAILDGVPGDPDDPSRTTIDLGGRDGVLHALEYNHSADGGARFGVGGWLYSADFDRIEATVTAPRDDGNAGVYGFVEGTLYRSDAGASVRGFLRYGVANDDLNVFDRYAGAGIVASGLVSSRPDDRFGLAIASAGVGDPWDRATGGANSHETSIELTYSTRLTRWLRIQPDVQYILNPGANPGLSDAFVIGLRFELTTDHTITHR